MVFDLETDRRCRSWKGRWFVNSNRLQLATATLAFWIFAFPVLAGEKVSLLLRWDHQFQFAGYYAALWKGYYSDAGLEVTIRTPFKEGEGIVNSVDEVVSGRADFGIGAADLLIARDNGKPVVATGTIFHQSAAQFFIRRDSGYTNFSDLVRMRVARRLGDLLDTEFQAMLLAEGIDPDTIKPAASYGGEGHLADGSLDLIPGYSFVTPLLLKNKGVDYISLNPQDYGIQFYGDTLFTREEINLRTYDLGASSFITKPVSFDDLVRIMKTITDYWLQIVSLPQH